MPAAQDQTTVAVQLSEVEAAAERIRALARRTPLMTSRLFDEASGVQAFFKCENLQRGGSFKMRGASNFLASLDEAQRLRGVVTVSSGNHAQAVAIAAAHFGVSATILMPSDAPKSKLASTRAYGPKIVSFDRQRDNRDALAQRVASETGAVLLPPYDHPWIIAGQGTAALELLEDQPELDALVVPLGGGGLLSGTLVAAKARRPSLRVFGVEPELANDWYRSLDSGQRIEISPPATLADGLRTTIPGLVTFPIVSALVDGVYLVTEQEIKHTLRFLLTRTKQLIEPSGAVAAAAVLHHKLPADVQRIGIVLSGGNVDLDVLAAICTEAA